MQSGIAALAAPSLLYRVPEHHFRRCRTYKQEGAALRPGGRPLLTRRNEKGVLRLPARLLARLQRKPHEGLRADGKRRSVEVEGGEWAVAADPDGAAGAGVLNRELVVAGRGAE